MSYISIKNLNKEFGNGDCMVKAVDDVNLDIEKGEFVVILGPSGSGKSTLLNIIGGLDSATSGEIFIDGQDIRKYNNEQLAQYRRKTIGFVFQAFNLIPVLSVQENMVLPVLIDKKQADWDYLNSIMKELGIYQLKDRLPSQISGGQQQRVAIGRALANNPDIILADEPTGNLDSEISDKVVAILSEMSKKYNKTLIMITHNGEIAKLADRVIRIKDGKLSE